MFEHWAAKMEWDALEYIVSYWINAKGFNISTLLFILILLFTLVFLATTVWNRVHISGMLLHCWTLEFSLNH